MITERLDRGSTLRLQGRLEGRGGNNPTTGEALRAISMAEERSHERKPIVIPRRTREDRDDEKRERKRRKEKEKKKKKSFLC